MSTVVLFYVVMGASVLALTLLYRRSRKRLPPKQPEPPEWHKGHFHDPV